MKFVQTWHTFKNFILKGHKTLAFKKLKAWVAMPFLVFLGISSSLWNFAKKFKGSSLILLYWSLLS